MAYHFSNADYDLKSSVWWKGSPIEGLDSEIWMHDRYGAAMKWSEHGNRGSKNGWEIDHIRPVSAEGSDDLSNLQPLQWENNVEKGDTYPY